MTTREQKFIDLKVLVNVQDIKELAKDSKLFKKYGVEVGSSDIKSKKSEIALKTPYAKEISWLFFQLEYIFVTDEDFYFELIIQLKPFLKRNDNLNEIVDFILQQVSSIP